MLHKHILIYYNMTRKEFHTIEDSDVIFNINSKGWFLKGWSKAGFKTGFLLYPFKILFDCGIYTSQNPNIIFLTHQHTDHTQAIGHICSKHKSVITTVYLPKSSIKFITKYERAIAELSNPDDEKLTDEQILVQQNIKLLQANPNDIVDLMVNNQELQIEVLKAYHNVDSNGYGFSSWKKQIKPEYKNLITNLSDEEKINMNKEEILKIKQNRITQIKELKNKQIEMYNKIIKYEFAFFCDSSIHNFTVETEWKKYPVIICECTGLDVTELNSIHDYEHHTSLFLLKPIMLENKHKKWFLIHVSLYCSDEQITQIETELISEGLDVKICR